MTYRKSKMYSVCLLAFLLVYNIAVYMFTKIIIWNKKDIQFGYTIF